MGCSSSKRIEAAMDVYRPPPSSFAVFDINSIKEPWLSFDDNSAEEHQQKPTHVPPPILEKLNKLENEAAPRSWDEVRKALEDLKPTFNTTTTTATINNNKNPVATSAKPVTVTQQPPPKKVNSFHTLEELEAKLSESTRTESEQPTDPRAKGAGLTEPRVTEARGKLKDNIFIKRDREEREKEGKLANYERMMSAKRDPLAEFPEKCPPGGADKVVIYTTSLRGVRRTYEDCSRVKDILDLQRVVYDERDVSFHGGFLSELKELLGEAVGVPCVFVKGRYVGGVEQLVQLDESGRLGRILSWAGVERGVGRQACEGCGGARFVNCFDCGGSCKVMVDGGVKERCGKCNENGLVLCPACL